MSEHVLNLEVFSPSRFLVPLVADAIESGSRAAAKVNVKVERKAIVPADVKADVHAMIHVKILVNSRNFCAIGEQQDLRIIKFEFIGQWSSGGQLVMGSLPWYYANIYNQIYTSLYFVIPSCKGIISIHTLFSNSLGTPCYIFCYSSLFIRGDYILLITFDVQW